MYQYRNKISIILLAIIILTMAFSVSAMESKNYKITEDSVDSSKVPGAVDTYKIKDNRAGAGLASSVRSAGRVMPLGILLALMLAVGISLFSFFKKLKTQKSKVNEYRA